MSSALSKTPEPFFEGAQPPGGFEQFLERNQKSVAALAALLILGAIGLTIYRAVDRGNEEAAGADLSKSKDLATLQAVIKDHPNSAAAGSARVLLADNQWTEGQQDAAIQTLRDFLSANPDHPARPSALASLGTKLSAQGKTGDAIPVFEDLLSASSGTYLAPFALLSLGDIARDSGDAAKAEEYYQRARSDYPESTFSDGATRRMSLLKAKPPVEIEAPPAPTPAPGDSPTPAFPGFPAPPAGLELPGTDPVPTPAPGLPEQLPGSPGPAAPSQP